ncbi:GTPase HflX [Desulfovibrio mangrovi]|uniref:GTPase HflX n=1 Tax=Desulfovibrio mangrovi TaxID=2976983 RepID=UPI003B84608B
MSASVARQIGLLIDRQGRPQLVIVGDTGAIYIPELPRARLGTGRLRGLRLMHTHLTDTALSQEDLMDMLFLRLDSVGVLTLDEFGSPAHFQYAHLVPTRSEEGETADAEADMSSVSRRAPRKGEVLPDGPKPYTVHDMVAWDRVEVDFNAQTEALEDEMARALTDARVADGDGERAVLVSVSTQPRNVQESYLDELRELARTAGIAVVGQIIQRVPQVNPKFIMGKGKLAELEVLCLQGNAGLVVFDGELSPAQLRNLTDATERKVLDRTQLILDIFAQHATSRAGKLQVEMAQLQYTMPRLVGKNRAMDRLMGGIGGRGPGETKLETDRRKIRDRIARIKGELKTLSKQRSYARDRRAKARVPVAALVGYTNAGKSTTLNTLTNSDVLAENKLFATLDPTTRRLRFPQERELILTDTVGFIRSLPKELKEAFEATLEELEAADLLLHVADAGHPEVDKQIAAVESILNELGLHDIPSILILNKWDTLDEEARQAMRYSYPQAIPISARSGDGLDELSKAIISRVDWERGLVQYQGIMAEEVVEDAPRDDWDAWDGDGKGILQ